MARQRPQGGVDTASESFDARGVAEAIEVAARALDAFLAGQPGVGVLTDRARGQVVWSHRIGMPPVPHQAGAAPVSRSTESA